MTLRADIESAINRNSAENGSDTPDYILARYMEACLAAFDLAVRDRDEWHGFTGATNPYPERVAPVRAELAKRKEDA